MQKIYCPNHIENIVQQHWDKNQTFYVTEDKTREKYYCLSMMPYPSGNLHMGHVRNYTIGDVISRYQRMLGKNVLQPVGWDAFGLPAEQAAITNNTQPSEWTYTNIRYMKNQLKLLGFAYDWSREIITCQPQYYRWEQWFFTVLYKKGLVYRNTTTVNWCPYHKTVLANEQVINNCCWRCQTTIQYKKLPQWFIKITNYADQLLSGLNQLHEWPKKVKTMQKNWIGYSTGVNIIFKIDHNNYNNVTVHLKRLDTFMGITYLTISIDHPITLQAAKTDPDLAHFVQTHNIILNKFNKHDLNHCKKKGIFSKIYAIHPITEKKLPIWVSNFKKCMESCAIGATGACPAHNQQDWEFAYKYNLLIHPVIKLPEGGQPDVTKKAMTNPGILFNSDNFDGLKSNDATNIIYKALVKQGLAKFTVSYNLKDWSISRQRYWGVPIPMITLKDGSIIPIPINQLPVTLPNNIYYEKENKENTLHKNSNWIKTTYKNQIAFRDTDTFDTFMESSWYYARYTCPHYQKAMLDTTAANYWLPIDQYVGGIEHAIMHLMYFRFYHKLMRDEGLVHSDEPAVRLLCQGMILSDSFYYLSKKGQKIWVSPTNITIKRNTIGDIIKCTDLNGNDLIYAGMCKMSKSKNNGIDPNIVIKQYGADSVRFFIMFAAPVQASLEWKESGIEGAKRFLNRLWNITYQHIQTGLINNFKINNLNDNQRNMRFHIHKTIVKVTDDIDRRQSFNTALASIMILVNKLHHAPKKDIQDRVILQEALSVVIRLLYPFTPHISFILWKTLGNQEDIDYIKWPVADTKALKYKKNYIIIQINGKTRKKIEIPLHANKNTIYEIAKKDISLNKFFIKKINKIIYIPNKIINFLTQ